MNATCRLFGGVFLGMLVASGAARAQGRGGGAWTTAGADAQRTSSIRADAKISVASMQQPGFQFLWKRKLDSPGAPISALTQPVLLPNIIAYKGFKALAFVGASSDNVYAIDYELNRMFWTQHLATAVSAKGTAGLSRRPGIDHQGYRCCACRGRRPRPRRGRERRGSGCTIGSGHARRARCR